MREKFTPGPWVAKFEPAWGWCVKVARQYLAFKVKKEADATLLASAPDLYAALELWQEYNKLDPLHPDSIEVYKLARSKSEAALLKARGPEKD